MTICETKDQDETDFYKCLKLVIAELESRSTAVSKVSLFLASLCFLIGLVDWSLLYFSRLHTTN